MQDLVAEYQQYQDATYVLFLVAVAVSYPNFPVPRRRASMRRSSPLRKTSRLVACGHTMPLDDFIPFRLEKNTPL
jgi:hypothetical protein